MSLLSLVKSSGSSRNSVTSVTSVIISESLDKISNRTENASVISVIKSQGNRAKITDVTEPKTPLLPKNNNDYNKITYVTAITGISSKPEKFPACDNQKLKAPVLSSGLEWVQKPESPWPDDWCAAWDLRWLAADYGLRLERLEDGSYCLQGADRDDVPGLLDLAAELFRQAWPYIGHYLAKEAGRDNRRG